MMWMMHDIRKALARTRRIPSVPKRDGRSYSLRLQQLEDRIVPDGMSLVGNWHEHAGHQYADGWAEGNYAYIGHFQNASGVDIIDISDPTNPVQVANFRGTGGDNEIRDIEIQNGIGFFSSDSSTSGGIFVVDLSDPTNPVQLARIDPSNGGARHVHTLSVDGAYLYEADSATSIIRVFDISDPSNPMWVRNIVSASSAVHEVTAMNGRLYTAGIFSNPNSEIYDITNVGDPDMPVPLLATINSGSFTHTAWPTEDGNYVAIARETLGGDVKIWDVSDLSNPVIASTISLPTTETYCMHQPMIVGNLLYIAAYEAGVLVYDISDPANPVQVGSYKTYYGPITETGAWGVYAYFGTNEILGFDMQTGLYILSLDNPPSRPAAGHARRTADAVSAFPTLVFEARPLQDQAQADGLIRTNNPGTDQNFAATDSRATLSSSSRSFAVLNAALNDWAMGETADALSVLVGDPLVG
jgi:choice-of-anchor B domain-containing protein